MRKAAVALQVIATLAVSILVIRAAGGLESVMVLPACAALALAAAWAGFVLANLIASYPAPVIGAGAATVLGWLISMGLKFGCQSSVRAQEP